MTAVPNPHRFLRNIPGESVSRMKALSTFSPAHLRSPPGPRRRARSACCRYSRIVPEYQVPAAAERFLSPVRGLRIPGRIDEWHRKGIKTGNNVSIDDAACGIPRESADLDWRRFPAPAVCLEAVNRDSPCGSAASRGMREMRIEP
ncbi:hypothetical protein DSECCO2_51500 [anaerobic digester metagenome]